MYQGYLIFLNAAHVIIRLLLDEIYASLGINIWLNAKCIWIVHFKLDLITIISHRQAVNLSLHDAILCDLCQTWVHIKWKYLPHIDYVQKSNWLKNI